MIRGAHVVLYSTNADADRAFFRDVLAYPSVDAGHGWLIFALPPAELAIHPADVNGAHELFLMCDDVQAFIAQMAERDIACSDVSRERWGLITGVTLPGGGSVRVYEPTHPPRSTRTNRRIGVCFVSRTAMGQHRLDVRICAPMIAAFRRDRRGRRQDSE